MDNLRKQADMAQSSRPCKGCGALIYRTAPVAPIRHYCSPECRPRCSVEGCEKPRHGNLYCSAHHTRWRKYGDPLAPLTRKPVKGQECSVDGCDQPMRKHPYCVDHYGMWRRHGEIRPWSYKWGDGGYGPTHALLRRERGLPSQYPCVDCGRQAQEWSYDGGDPDEQIDPERGALFTRNLEAYSPRCIRCHRFFDENPIAMRTPP